MKRDNDLVRDLLLEIERRPAGERIAADTLQVGERPELDVVEHLLLLNEAGYIEWKLTQYYEDTHQRLERIEILRLTWAGHELIEAIRNDTVWEKTKERTAKVGGSVSMNVLAEVAGSIAKGLLGLP